MVYNPDLTASKKHITGISVADLTSTQLDTIQEKFGNGANLISPYPREQLFIHDKREWSQYSHADMKRAMPDTDALIVVDSRSAEDGSIWYIDRFATDEEVEEGQAENINTLFKLRMKLEAVVISYQNYSIANTSIDEDMEVADIPLPVPENFDQDEAFNIGFDYVGDRYICPTWVTATPDEYEESTNEDDLGNFAPRPDIVYRLKPEAARSNGLQVRWTLGRDAEDVTLPDGTLLKFPEGSKVLQCKFDAETAMPTFERPKGSL